MKNFKVLSCQSLKESVGGYLQIEFPSVLKLLIRHKIVIKYVFSGGTAVVVNLLVLYVSTDVFRVWYVASSGIAFCVSLATGFFLQKFWTFRDSSLRRAARQATLYAAVGVLNLVIGPAILYLVVEMFGVWYMTGQFLVMMVLAVESYFINRFITFRKDSTHEGLNV